LPEIKVLGEIVRLGNSAAEYEAHVKQLLAASDLGPKRERSELMKKESWDFKVEQMEALLEKYLPDKAPALQASAASSTTI
jgi:hypothetical protein